jgi:hypothetical protein
MHVKHQGHDAMHAEMFLIFILAMVVAQVVLVAWKRWHFRSYQSATLVGLWLIPLWICIGKGWWRFIASWVVFTTTSGYIWYLVSWNYSRGIMAVLGPIKAFQRQIRPPRAKSDLARVKSRLTRAKSSLARAN